MQAVHPAARPMQLRPYNVRRPSQAVYRRRRLVVLLCAASLVGTAWFGMQQLTGALGDGPLTGAERSVSGIETQLVGRTRLIVQPGDTLWSLARRAQPNGDVRPLVSELSKQLRGGTLMAGQTIEIPAS